MKAQCNSRRMNQMSWLKEITGPDPMLDEIAQVRAEIHEIVKDLSPEDRSNWYHQQTLAAAKSMGKELKPHPTRPFTYIFA
jgi:hypothetical protein